MGIRHRLSQSPSIWLFAALLAAVVAASAWAATASAQGSLDAPDAVSSVNVTRSDGQLTATWDAPSGATSYHVTYSSTGGASWDLAALAHASNSIAISADNAKTYIVGVRAKNDNGGSGWVNSPSSGPYTPTPTPTPPDAVASVTVTRADGSLAASWTAPAGATSYHVTYTDDGAQSWQLAALSHTGTSITFSADNAKTYIVGVRAKNSSGGSNWVNSPAVGPYTPGPTPPGAVASVTVTRSDGTLTASWDAPSGATGYHVTYTDDGAQSWQLAALDHAETSIEIDADNDSTYIVGVRAKNSAGGSNWRNSPSIGPYTPPPTLTVTDPTPTGATLTMDNYSGEWYYTTSQTSGGGANTGGAGIASAQSVTCTGPVNGSEATVTGLDSDTGYTITAYGNGQCGGAEIASATAQTQANLSPGNVSVSNIGQQWNYTCSVGDRTGGSKCAVAFTTGGRLGGYTLSSVSGFFHQKQSNPPDIVVAIHAPDANNSNHPAATAKVTLSDGPGQPGTGANNTWNCSGTDCALDPNTTYFIVMSTAAGGVSIQGHRLRTTNSGSEVNTPAGNGWSIANSGLTNNNGQLRWQSDRVGMVSIVAANANAAVQMSASAETTEGATLTVTSTGDWWYAQTSPNDSLCTSAGGASVNITGLLPGRAYTYAAYDNRQCLGDAVTTATFTTLYGLRADGVTDNSATLVIEGSGLLTNWWYKRTAPSGDDTCYAVGYGQKSVALSLTPGESYTYTAYVDSGCAAAVGAVSFKTVRLDGSADTSADTLTINIVNWTKADGTTTAAWWYQQTAPTAGTCTSVAEGTSSVTLTGFTFDHTNRNQYAFEAYSKDGCDAADAIASKHLFPASSSRGGVENVTATTATFLAYNVGSNSTWGYKSTETGAACVGHFDGFGSQGVASAPVTGLTPGTEYTFKAYMSTEAAPCSPAFDTDVTFTTAKASVSNLGQRQVGSTMPVGWSANDWTASSFTTGTGADSFTLNRVTLLFGDSGIGMPAPEYDLNVRLFSAGSDGNPGTAIANAALSGPARPPENSQGIYTCSGDGCALDSGETYYVVLSVPVPQCRTVEGVQDCSGTTGRAYYWQRSGTNNETASPADSGFSIANEIRHTDDGGSTWTRLVRAVMFSVEYGHDAPSLTASDIATSTATLTLANEGGESAWHTKRITPAGGACSSAIANGSTLALTGLQQNTGYTYAAYRDSACKQVVASGTFTTLRTMTASSVTDTTATLTLSGSGTGNWYAKYTTPSGGTCSSGVGYGAALDLSNLNRGTAYTYEAYSDSSCTTVIGRTSFTTEANWIAVSGIHTTTATLTLTGHTGSWWLKRTSPAPAGTCEAGEADFSHALSSLTAGSTYAYAAYGDATCTTALRSVTFTTAVTVSNIGATGSGSYKVGHYQQGSVAAQGFTTGSNTSGYTLSSITIRVNGKTGSPGEFTVKLHSASGVNIGPALATLSGSDPTGNGNYTYACTPSSTNNCSLSRNTTYYIWLSAPNAPGGSNYYDIARTGSTGETRVPSANGWSLADNGRHRPGNVWDNSGVPLKLEVAAVPPGQSLVVSDVTSTTATLTLTGKAGGWWLKETSPNTGTCTAGESDYSHALSSLAVNTDYTFRAYSDSACATEIASAAFTHAAQPAHGPLRDAHLQRDGQQRQRRALLACAVVEHGAHGLRGGVQHRQRLHMVGLRRHDRIVGHQPQRHRAGQGQRLRHSPARHGQRQRGQRVGAVVVASRAPSAGHADGP